MLFPVGIRRSWQTTWSAKTFVHIQPFPDKLVAVATRNSKNPSVIWWSSSLEASIDVYDWWTIWSNLLTSFRFSSLRFVDIDIAVDDILEGKHSIARLKIVICPIRILMTESVSFQSARLPDRWPTCNPVAIIDWCYWTSTCSIGKSVSIRVNQIKWEGEGGEMKPCKFTNRRTRS